MPRRLLGPDEHRLIARMHVDGAPDSAIARAVAEQFGKPVDRSTIRKARARPGVQEMIVEEHRRKVDRDRAARYRVRKAEREQVAADIERGAGPPPSATSLERRPPHGQNYPYITEGGIFHGSNIGSGRFATRGDYLRNGWKVPANFEDDPGFGQPGYPRHPLGYVPPEERLIRPRAPAGTHEGDIELVKPVPARDVAALEAAGWTRVEQRAAPARGQAGQKAEPEAGRPASQQVAAKRNEPTGITPPALVAGPATIGACPTIPS